MGRDPSRHKVETCFFKLELTIIFNRFLNIRLSFGRHECNSDRCPSRKCDTFAFCVNGLVSVLTIDCKKHGRSVRDVTRRFLKSVFEA